MGTEQGKEGTGEERVEVRTGPRPALPASQQRAVDEFWRKRQEEMEATVDFNDRMLPMSRLKRVIRAEEDGMMIAADTPAYLAKLCELFVQELAVRAWACAQSHHRRIILDSDIAEAVASTESYDFLAAVLLEHQREARLVGRATPTTPPATAARLITRKRHMPDPNPPRPVHGVRRIRPRALPVTPTPPPSDVHYVPVPFPFPSAPIGATATADGLMILPPINHATTGRAFFLDRNGGASFAGENSAAETMASPPPAGPAGAVALPTVHPAAYYLCSYPVAFAVGNTDPNVIPPEIVDGNVADGNGDGGQQQQQSENVGGNRESVLVPQSNDVQEDAAAGDAGGMFLEEILMDEDLLFPDAGELFPSVGAAPDSEEFIVDQDVLDDVFANPSSSTSSD